VNNGFKNVTVRIPNELHESLVFVCREMGLNRNEIIKELLFNSLPVITRYIREHDKGSSFSVAESFNKSSSLQCFHFDSLSKIDEFADF
jgi:hypothetical protein